MEWRGSKTIKDTRTHFKTWQKNNIEENFQNINWQRKKASNQ